MKKLRASNSRIHSTVLTRTVPLLVSAASLAILFFYNKEIPLRLTISETADASISDFPLDLKVAEVSQSNEPQIENQLERSPSPPQRKFNTNHGFRYFIIGILAYLALQFYKDASSLVESKIFDDRDRQKRFD